MIIEFERSSENVTSFLVKFNNYAFCSIPLCVHLGQVGGWYSQAVGLLPLISVTYKYLLGIST